MKKIIFLLQILFVTYSSLAINYQWQGTVNSDWNTNTNWLPNGIPGIGDDVTILSAPNSCILDINRTIAALSITSGTLDLGGNTLIATLNTVFTAGNVVNGILAVNSGITNACTINNTTFSATLTVVAGRIFLNGGVYNSPVSMEQIGNTNTGGSGGATFYSSLSFTLSGNGYFRTNGSNTFEGDVELINNGGDYILFELNNGSTYNGNVIITNNSNSEIRLAYQGNSTFNGNIEFNSTANGEIRFCELATASADFGAGVNLSIGATGFNSGQLILRRITQITAVNQTLALGGTVARIYSLENNWGGAISFTAPRIQSENSIYNGTVFFEKTGAGNENCGGNIFRQNTTIINASTGQFRFGGNNPDIFEGNLHLRNIGTSSIEMARVAAGNEFYGDITIENTSGNGVYFGNNGGTSTLTNGSTIAVGGLGFSNGEFYLNNLIQLGNAPQNIVMGLNSRIRIANSVFNAPINYVSERLWISNSEFNGITYFEKNGAGNDNSAGGNFFNHNTTLVNSGSGHLLMGNANPDAFNAQLIVSNSSSNYIYLAHNAIGNEFNGNVILESVGSSGIRFGEGNGTATLANGFAFSIGALGFDSGELRFRNVTQLGATAQNLTLTGNARILSMESEWEGSVSFIAPRTYMRGSTYHNTVYWEKTGAFEDNCRGGNTFFGELHMVNSGTNLIRMSNNIADSPDFYNNTSRFSSTGTSIIMLADYSLGNEFNGDIIVESTGSNGIRFGQNNGSATLSATHTVSEGSLGFDNGELRFRNFTQIGTTAQSLTLTGTAYLSNYESDWGGNITFIAPRFYTRGTTYNGLAYIEKTGLTDDDSPGGNLFRQDATIVNSGDRRLRFATNMPDIFDANTFVRNTGTSVIWLADNSTGNEFNGNIQVESVGSNGITFGRGGGGSATMAATFTITVGPLGFESGELIFNTFTQLGTTPQNVTLTGTGYFRNFESNWGGNVSFTAPRMYTRGTVYNGTAYLEKTGAGNDPSYGNNIFHQNTSLINSGTSYFGMGWDNPDIFNGDLLVQANNEGIIYIAHNSSGNSLQGDLVVENTSNNQIIYFNETANGDMTFNGNIELNSSPAANGIRFGNQLVNTSFLTQAAGSTITIGSGGFHNGELRFVNFTKLGSDAINLTLSGDGYFRTFESEWNGDVAFISPRIYTRGSTYNGQAYLEKTGNTDDASAGENVFNQQTTLVNSGVRYFGMGFTNPDVYNADLVLRNISSHILYIGHNSNGNQYNGNIQLESTGDSQGIRFHQGDGDGDMSVGNTISVGGLGFTDGELYLRNFTQSGGTAQNFTLTGTALLTNHDSNWSGTVDFRSPRHITRGTTYQQIAYLAKTGAVNDASLGGNTFMQEVEFLNSGTGYFMPANTVSNTFLSHVTYSTTSTGLMYPTYNCESFYHGNININASNVITFAATTNGRVRMVNSASQFINDIGASPMPIFRRLTTDKTGGEVTLNIPIAISVELELLNGVIFSDATNLLIMNHNSIVASVSDAAYVSGPVRKIGNAAFTFPIGKSGFYRPASISNPTNAAHHFTAEYFLVDPVDEGYDDTSLEAPLVYISDCEYWMIDRTNGASNVNVTLSYRTIGVNGCSGVVDPSELRVARWDGGMWRDHGNGGTFGIPNNGSIVTSGPVTAFSPFTLATLDMINPLPIELIEFDAKLQSNEVELFWSTASERNNDYFLVERSANGQEFHQIGQVQGAGNSNSKIDYNLIDSNPLNGISYYRLKQVDFDGTFSHSDIKSVYFGNKENELTVYPNPIQSGNTVYINSKNLKQGSTIQIYDSKGKLVAENNLQNNEILIDFPAGVYFVKLVHFDDVLVSKLIVE